MTFKEIKLRWQMPSPEFFKKLKLIGIWLTLASGTIIGLHSQFPGLHIPDILDKVAGYLAAAGFIIAAVAKFPVSDPDLLEKKLNPNP
jgi:hypothetical protein